MEAGGEWLAVGESGVSKGGRLGGDGRESLVKCLKISSKHLHMHVLDGRICTLFHDPCLPILSYFSFIYLF